MIDLQTFSLTSPPDLSPSHHPLHEVSKASG